MSFDELFNEDLSVREQEQDKKEPEIPRLLLSKSLIKLLCIWFLAEMMNVLLSDAT